MTPDIIYPCGLSECTLIKFKNGFLPKGGNQVPGCSAPLVKCDIRSRGEEQSSNATSSHQTNIVAQQGWRRKALSLIRGKR